MRAIVYTRVSTEHQAEHGVSLDAQAERCASYADLYGFDVVETVRDDGYSAKTLDRPGLRRALRMLRDGEADALIVAKLDRLTRSVVDLGTLIDADFGPDGFALVSVGEQVDTSTAAGRMVLNLLTTVSQWEREATGERTSAALQSKRRRNERVGAVRYGYRLARDGRTEIPDDAEQAVIKRVHALRADGLSLRAVARALNSEGMETRSGKAWAPTQIKRLSERAPVA